MTIFIFNHRLTNEQQIVEAQSIAEDQTFLWEGSKKELQNLGFNENQVGGFELVSNKLVFNQEKYNTYLKSKLPLASGKILVSKVEKAFLGQSFEFRMQLQSLFLPLKATLESETCNPLSVNDFEFVFKFLDTLVTKLTAEQITIFKNLLTEFVNENQFFDYKPEVLKNIAKKLKS